MLANGIKLKMSETKGSNYKVIEGLKEVPELGIDPEKVENTTLADTIKQYEFGIGDAGELEYKFKYENSKATSSYRTLRKLADTKAVRYFEQEYPDGTTVHFSAQIAVKLGGGGVNSAIEFTLKLALQSDLEFTDPVVL
ncbi:phage tail tube protein [Streptococcus suis]|uniref:phage tail tube protein n=1 Tax=Streptococcus suis TaxID=1307 RepID=UPI000D0BE85B|nr:phage tail tube protein [Streptococcus suis]MBS7854622.1 phage tail protein [Streptococcus suis]MBS7977681.1 phage tail protein [Streptococcus suis]MDG3109140.1 phage tail protein [Streptococcus suis]MDG3147964.1 phage tail protein [Streptococcus suis]MDG3170284.1 phage tail protein [Streptococcus suis]